MSKNKPKKVDRAIIIALIGLTGTLITALLTSPVILKILDKTPTPETGEITDSEPVIVFSEDFEKGYASGLSFTSEEWKVMNYKGGQVLEVSGTSDGNTSVSFGPNDFSDGAIEFRLLFVNFDGFILNFRSDVDVETYTLYLAPDGGEIQLGYGGAAGDWNLEPFENGVRSVNFTEDVWYNIRLETAGPQITLWIDDKKLLTSQDSRLNTGGMEFAVQYDGTVLLDDITVYQLNP